MVNNGFSKQRNNQDLSGIQLINKYLKGPVNLIYGQGCIQSEFHTS